MLIAKKLRYSKYLSNWQCVSCKEKFIGLMELTEHLFKDHEFKIVYLDCSNLSNGIKSRIDGEPPKRTRSPHRIKRA